MVLDQEAALEKRWPPTSEEANSPYLAPFGAQKGAQLRRIQAPDAGAKGYGIDCSVGAIQRLPGLRLPGL